MDDVPAITATRVSKRFGESFALGEISFSIPKGSVYCIAGPNGSGKSTLLNIISGSLAPDSGKIEVNGSFGYCHQNPLLFNDLTLSQNLGIFSEMLSADQKSTKNAISLLGLREALSSRISELSSGTKKKAELAIALLGDPEILLLDEPTTGLDSRSSQDLLLFIKSASRKKTLVIATHQLADLESIATHLFVLKKGEKACEARLSVGLEAAYKKTLKA